MSQNLHLHYLTKKAHNRPVFADIRGSSESSIVNLVLRIYTATFLTSQTFDTTSIAVVIDYLSISLEEGGKKVPAEN